MIVKGLKTEKVTSGSIDMNGLLDKHLKGLKEGNIVAVTSKVVALCESRTEPIGSIDKEELVKRESDLYLPLSQNKYGLSFTITHNTLIPAAGIDESNGNGDYVLWPEDPQASANKIREYLAQRFGLKRIGVVLTDSTARPLHYGTEGVAIGYSGLSPTKSYIGQTPIAIIEDVDFLDFQDRNPTRDEVEAFYLDHMDDDLFAQFLQKMDWLLGARGKK
jgi:dihydrofolate synthase / folylpolyglutamate synthase